MTAKAPETSIGSVRVKLYAGLEGAEPIEVGQVVMPLRLNAVRRQTVEADLQAAVEVVAVGLRSIFDTPADTEES